MEGLDAIVKTKRTAVQTAGYTTLKRVQVAANRMSAVVKKACAAAKRAKLPTRLLIMIDMIVG